MKKILLFCMALVLIVSIIGVGSFAAISATPTAASVLVNDEGVSFEAYNISGNNYFKLRDLAHSLNGTEKQFEIGWDADNNAISITTGSAYTSVGGELEASGRTGQQSGTLSTAKVYIDGVQAHLTAYNIAGNNYFKLRDVGAAIDFGVGWNDETSTISIKTAIGYSEDTQTSNNMVVHFIDVGQGDATFIELPNGETMLIDAGNEENGAEIVSYIKALGFDAITYLVATHPHADHIGGMAYVINHLTIGNIYMPKATSTTQTYAQLLTAILDKGLTVKTAKAGVNLVSADSLSVKMLAPNKEQYDDLNDYSAVIKITYNEKAFLFMGDAEKLSENEITGDVSADVLKVGHHGSSSSTGDAFLSKVNPSYAVISVGTDNDYGHPMQTTLDKLNAAGSTIYRTDLDGTIVFTSDGITISVDKVNQYKGEAADDTPANTSTDVIISSVDKEGEIVTIANNGSADVDMTGWVLVSVTGNQRYTFPSYTLKAGASVTVASGDASGDLKWTTANIWNNSSSDPAELYDSFGQLIDSY